jgi:hypothetical protein
MVPSLHGLAPFQIGFVGRDVERAAGELDARLGAGPWRGWLFVPQGQGRVVRSLEQTTSEMEAAGHPAVARIHAFGAAGDGAAAYFDTVDALGIMVEAVEPPARMPPTDFTF